MENDKKTSRLRKDSLSWFDVERYKGAEKWALVDWNWNLSFRFILKGMINYEAARKGDSHLHNILLDLLVHPVPENPRYSGPMLAKGLPRVWDREVIDVYFDRFAFDSKKLKDVLATCESWSKRADEEKHVSPLPDLLRKSFDDLLTERGFSNSREQVIFVDLNVSDEQLLEDFREWLRKKRNAKQMKAPRKNIDESDMREWVRYRALALIDIDLFCAYTNTTVSYATLGSLLFPNEYDVDLAERIRKVVRPLAARLMRSEFVSALDEQVSRAEPKTS